MKSNFDFAISKISELVNISDKPFRDVIKDVEKLYNAGIASEDIFDQLKEYYNGERRRDS